jgi:hypothetical protein
VTSYHAYNAKGALLRTFSHKDLAEAYRAEMAREGSAITVKAVREHRRLVA